MKPLSLREVRQAVGGRLISAQPSGLPILAVCSDSRRMEPHSLFIALHGENHDGHDHLPHAAAGGAIAALVERPVPVQLPNLTLIQVPDARAAMGKLATYVRQQMRAKVIGVAGSNGKTSTKHLIHAALSAKLHGSMSPKSFNNEIGVPLTIFPADPNQDYLVLEMGTNHPGEILRLTRMAQPDIAVITNCGAEHLEFLGDLDGVRKENASILADLNPNGLLVVNGDDPQLLDAVSSYRGKRITFGFKPGNDLFASEATCTQGGTSFRLNNSRTEFFVPMLGRHTASNALAAIAVARRLGVSESLVCDGLSQASGPEWRLQLQKLGRFTLLNDAYNANPNSMRAALETLRDLPTSGRRIAVLGDMRELGETADRYHEEIGRFAVECRVDELYCVGPRSKRMAASAADAGMKKPRITHLKNAADCVALLRRRMQNGDLLLLKASRGIRLDLIAGALAESAVSRKIAS